MRTLVLSALFVVLSISVGGQTMASYSNSDTIVVIYDVSSSVNAELGGNGGVYSLNYQRSFERLVRLRLSWCAGLSVYPRGSLITMSVPVSVIYRKTLRNADDLVFGAGQTLILSNTKGGYIRGTFRLGYRWHILKKNAWYIEAAYTPFYSYLYNFQWDNWLGVSFGYYFQHKKP
jgi:hypothetical protein